MSILVISPHMDDETFGAGGTLIKYAEKGEKTYWLNISNTKEEYGYSKEVVNNRERQYQQVIEKLEFTDAIDFKLKPAHLDEYSDSEMIGRVAEVIGKIKPNTIITAYPGDIHSDHFKVFSWVKALSKSFRNPSLKRFMLMETISETDFALPSQAFAPNYFVDISNCLDKKLDAVKIYSEEIGEHPFPRSLENIKALATNRGAVAGTKYAEAFVLVRGIEK